MSGSNIRRINDCSVIDSKVLHSTKGKKICFIRFVERWKETNNTSGITILRRFVEVPDPYVNQYVFVTLDLETAKLLIISEHQGVISEIMNQPFKYTV